MRRNQVAVVGAAETTKLGVIPDMSQIQLHADAALNAIADAGLTIKDIDGVATAVEQPQQVCHYLGIKPDMGRQHLGRRLLVHAARPPRGGGDRRRSVQDRADHPRGKRQVEHRPPAALGRRRQPQRPVRDALRRRRPAQHVHDPGAALPEDATASPTSRLAMVSVVQREWAAKNPRATMKDPITVDDVLNSRMIAYPFRILQCCLVTDGGGALILTSAERAKDFPTKPVYVLGTGESVGDADGQPDGELQLLARVQGRGPAGVPGSRHQPHGRRSPDDLRRLRAPAAVRPRRPRLHAARGNRQVHRRRQHRARAASCR